MKRFWLLGFAVVAGAVAYVWLTSDSGRDIWDDVHHDFD